MAPDTPTAPPFPPFIWTPSPDLATAQQKAQSGKLVGGGIAVAGVILLLTMPPLFLLWLPLILVGIAKFNETSGPPNNQLVQRYRDIEMQWQRALGDWRDKNGAAPFEKLKMSLLQKRNELKELSKVEAAKIAAYHRKRRSAQLDAFLNGFQIRRVKIKGIGPSRLATLTSYGIETAAHLTRDEILKVPGFGPTNSKPLLAWRKQVESRFVFNAAMTTADTAALNTIRNATASRSRELLERLRAGAQTLSQLAVDLRARQQAHDPALAILHRQRAQILGDLKHLGITPPAP